MLYSLAQKRGAVGSPSHLFGKYCSLILRGGVGYNVVARGGLSLRVRKKEGENLDMKFSKRIAAVAVCAALMCAVIAPSVSAAAKTTSSGAPVNVTLDGKPILVGEAVIINSVTYAPLRSFSELMGADDISWDPKTNTASVSKGQMTMQIRSGALYISANDRYFFTVERVLNIGGRLYVPIRALARPFGVEVGWDAASRTAELISGDGELVSGEDFYDADELYWLSRIISAESSGESLMGKLAVGSVVLNRKESSMYPDTIYGVIFDRVGGTQFTPVASGTIYKAPTRESVIAAKMCLEGYNIDKDVLFFMNPRIATSNWISKNRPYAFTIGNHAFYY